LRGAENVNFVVPINYARGMLVDSLSLSLDEMRSKLQGVDPVKTSARLPTRWKSLTSGEVNLVRIEGDHVYIEASLTAEQRNAGIFMTYDLVKRDSIYTGTGRLGFRCTMVPILDPNYTKACILDLPCAITLLSGSRIEGVLDVPSLSPADLDCKNCRSKRPAEKTAFVWMPDLGN
jgi:hypothetical protein